MVDVNGFRRTPNMDLEEPLIPNIMVGRIFFKGGRDVMSVIWKNIFKFH